MTGIEKLASVESQINACERGEKGVIHCPYCEQDNSPGDSFCCEKLMGAAMAILHRKETAEALELVDRIAEKVSRN